MFSTLYISHSEQIPYKKDTTILCVEKFIGRDLYEFSPIDISGTLGERESDLAFLLMSH